MCSLVSSTVNTFDEKSIALESDMHPNCSVLFVADCSIQSRFAVFVNPVKGALNQSTFEIELHVDDHVIWYIPRSDDKDIIRLSDSTDIEVKTLTTPLGDAVDLRYWI